MSMWLYQKIVGTICTLHDDTLLLLLLVHELLCLLGDALLVQDGEQEQGGCGQAGCATHSGV
jgi:hypothetical protein